MNKKLLDTRLRSLKHYSDEIKHLEDAIKVTQSTRQSILQALKEFVPFKGKEIILYSGKVMLIDVVGGIHEWSNEVYKVKISVQYMDSCGNWRGCDTLYIPIAGIEKIKILNLEELEPSSES